MDYYAPMTKHELSQRKLEEYAKLSKIIQTGRQNPIWFSEYFFGIELMDYQKWCFMQSWTKPYVVWLCCRGSGKALALDTPILTANGWKNMGSIHCGDRVFNQNGELVTVIYESNIFLNHDCYEIEFSDHEKIISDADHLWKVSDRNSRRRKNKCYYIIKTKDMVNNEYCTRNDGKNEYNYQVPLANPINFSKKSLPLHPYVLGIWLGDGDKSSARITCGIQDLKEMCKNINNCGYTTKIFYPKNRTPYIGISTVKHGGNHEINRNIMLDSLKELNVYKNKHIPIIYLTSSISQRYELLKGIMDTDGCCNKNGSCEITQKNYNLSLQISELLWSLGIKNTLSSKKASCNNKNFTVYRICFYVTKNNSCFKLKRKHEKLKDCLKLSPQSKSIIHIKKVPSVPTKCIKVNDNEGLFLCGKHFTVTHNTTLAAVFLQTKMLLIPNYKVFVSTNSSAQSFEVFGKIEDLALQRIPSFKTVTDIFANEVEKSTSDTGFLHNPAGHTFRLYNDSELLTLSTNLNALRGKRGSVFYDETAWQTKEQMAVTENFANVDTNFGLGVNKTKYYDPIQMPLQLLYASSAGDVTYPFYERYRGYSMKMIEGDSNYFVADLNVDAIYNFSTVDGEKIKSHLTKEQIDKLIEDDPDAAERELYNKFQHGAGQNAVVRMETIIKNSSVYAPELFNKDKSHYIFCYDPARNFDGSILSIFKVISDDKIGYKLKLVNIISMIDKDTKNKTPLPMTEQLKIIKQQLLNYKGERCAEWENIDFYIDSGSGGGGISAVADQLMEDWKDDEGILHKGIIDPVHKQYETSRKKYVNAMPIVHLIDPEGYKKIIYNALEKMTKLDLIEFPDYDGKDYLLMQNDKGESYEYKLSSEEQISLVQCNLAKNEMVYMCRYDTPNGGVQYELAKDKKNKMHDDKAYTMAMGAYALALLRREDLVSKPKQKLSNISFKFRRPQIMTM